MNEHVRLPRRKSSAFDLSETFIRRVDLSYANLEGADFTNADCSNSNFRGANFKDTILDGTILRGADLRDVTNLTRDQLSRAIVDEATRLPDYLL